MASTRRNKNKLITPISTLKVKNKKLVEILKARQCTRGELAEMGVTEYQISKLAINFKLNYQFEPSKNDFVYYILEKGYDPFFFLPDNGEEKLKIAKMADLHIGSAETDEKELINLFSYLWEEGYRIISMSGDLIDGCGVYRGQTENLTYATIDKQVDVAVSILSMFDFLYISNKGNHDASSTKNGGADAISLVQEKMVNKGKKFVYLKSYCGYIIYKGTAIQILHMDGGNSLQSDTYGNQKVVDAMNKTSSNRGDRNVNCIDVFGKKTPVINLITGHYHTLGKFMYGNMVVESPLTTQHTTDLINRRGIRSKTGARVSEMEIKDGKCVSEKGAIIFGRDVHEIFSVEHSTNLSVHASAPRSKKSSKKKQSTKANTNIDHEKINKVLRNLIKLGFVGKKELTKQEIEYIRQTYFYNVYRNKDGTIVYKHDNDEHTIVYSPAEQKGIVSYLEISNLFVGSKFFSEKAFREILDRARVSGVKHVHIGGNAIWGIPSKANAANTELFAGKRQVDKLVGILACYPEFHYYTIDGVCENTFIRSGKEEVMFNPMKYAEHQMKEKGIKFTAINDSKCDFLIYGIIFRMDCSSEERLKNWYTRDYGMVKSLRELMAKTGRIVKVNGKEYGIGTIFYGHVPTTIETYSGGMYVTSTAGPTIDMDNKSIVIKSNPEGAIVKALVNHGEILKFEREIIAPIVWKKPSYLYLSG